MARYKESERKNVLSKTRRLLLEAAAAEFAREGYHGANINRISTAAGFAKGTVYNHFPSKKALLLALIEDIAGNHYDFIAERVGQEDDPAGRLEQFFAAGFAFVVTYPTHARVMINTIYGPETEFKMVAYQAYQPLFQLVGSEILGAGMAQDIFRPVDAGATAGLLMTIYLGTASQVDEEGNPWMDPQQVADFAQHALLLEKV